jgi:TerC family integral membrane protein
MGISTIGTPAMWIGFIVFVLAMLALDLGVFHRKAHEIKIKEAAVWSLVWVSLAAVFAAGVYFFYGADQALEFATGYLIEKALAVDNIFIFLVIFSYFAVPIAYQHRILFWGVLGALLMRAGFIWLGAALLERFHWVLYVFGVILLITSLKLISERDKAYEPEKNPILRLFQRFVPMTHELRGPHLTVVENGKRLATPLLLVLVVIEATDLVFAVDSIPAIFAVTRDPFIVFTSNIFAILGLRSMYFLLAGAMEKFHYLKIGLALILGFVGAKMLLVDVVHIPIVAALGVVLGILAAAILASFLRARRKELRAPHAPSAQHPA